MQPQRQVLQQEGHPALNVFVSDDMVVIQHETSGARRGHATHSSVPDGRR